VAKAIDSFLTGDRSQEYLSRTLYRGPDSSQKLNERKTCSLLHRLLSCFFYRCSTDSKLLGLAKEKLAKELNVLHLMRSLRFLDAAVLELLPAHKVKTIRS